MYISVEQKGHKGIAVLKYEIYRMYIKSVKLNTLYKMKGN
jgi:hypothetical protein